ncbi:hypothetical protein AWZ03_011946 [Drosophila navojoa]|uniref:Uncharacterized protein n=1 Tax=Drosophila navojoa TaxID=7232 RepID=A0A484B0N6_DRONA|nr:hypothetical protein AWZ03_011946 [Drosophila navojoa]
MGKSEKNIVKYNKNKKGDEGIKKNFKLKRSRSSGNWKVTPVNAVADVAENEMVTVAVTLNMDGADDEPIDLKRPHSTEPQKMIQPKKPKLEIENEEPTKPTEIYHVLEAPIKNEKICNLNYNKEKQVLEKQTDGQDKWESDNVYIAHCSGVIFSSECNINEESAYKSTSKPPAMDEANGYNKGNIHGQYVSRRVIYKYEEKYGSVNMSNEDEAKPARKEKAPKFNSEPGKRRCSIL